MKRVSEFNLVSLISRKAKELSMMMIWFICPPQLIKAEKCSGKLA
jgi:hypothetical protein